VKQFQVLSYRIRPSAARRLRSSAGMRKYRSFADGSANGSSRSRLCKNFRAFSHEPVSFAFGGLRAFRVEKIAKNLALLDRLQNFAEFLHGLGRNPPD
jgi:hypothetical protein